MDIKDFILATGGILIALVVMHGFWIAFKARREPYRLDIATDIPQTDIEDDIGLLRGELPNGGARVRRADGSAEPARRRPEPRFEHQESMNFDAAPTLLDTVPESRTPPASLAAPEAAPESRTEKRTAAASVDVEAAPAPAPVDVPPRREAHGSDRRAEPNLGAARDGRAGRDISAHANERAKQDVNAPEAGSTATVREVKLVSEKRTPAAGKSVSARKASREPAPRHEQAMDTLSNVTPMRELLVVNLLAPQGFKYDGERLVNALIEQGLRHGEMNIFHRFEPTTRVKQFSVANVVEPGTFDLSDLERLHSPGMSFFLQLPGPADALAALENMFDTAHNIALDLGGELRDENLSVLTGQTKEHMRGRIADFARRRLSKRA